MGWTGSNAQGLSVKDYIIKELTSETDTHRFLFTDVSMRGNVAYGIYMTEDKHTGIVVAEAMVVLARKEDGWIYLKEMGESVGPYYYDAPKKLLDKLDALYPTPSKMAIEWRQKCRAKSAAAKKTPKLSYGDVIKLSHPLTFDFGGWVEKIDTFTYTYDPIRKNVFRTPSGHLCRITKLNTREFTVQGAAA